MVSDSKILSQEIKNARQELIWKVFVARATLRKGGKGSYEDYFKVRRNALLTVKNLPPSLKLLVADESLLYEFYPGIFKVSELAGFLLEHPNEILLEQQLLTHEFWQD